MNNLHKMLNIGPEWDQILSEEFEKPYFLDLRAFLEKERKNFQVFPKEENVFNAFNLCLFGNVKVVILGQDPYHSENQANGLAFAVNEGVKSPPSLVNIVKELRADLNLNSNLRSTLVGWAKQGVLLLNTTLTVQKGLPASHFGKGWELFTDEIIKLLSEKKEKIVFLLWGANAQTKCSLIDDQKHLILKTTHPSPFSVYRGFSGCKHFSKTNQYLISKNITPINWEQTV